MLHHFTRMQCEKKSKHARIETGYAFSMEMNNELVEKYNNQTSTQGSAI